MISLNIRNEREFLRHLGSVRGGLEIASAKAVNKGAKKIQRYYKRGLSRDFTVRRAFTKNAVQVMESNPVRTNGLYRPMPKINAVVGIRAMKGGGHYLVTQEFGRTKNTGDYEGGKIGVPTLKARVGKSFRGVVGRKFRKDRAKPRKLLVGGRDIRTFPNRKQKYAIIMRLARQEPQRIRQPFYDKDDNGNNKVMRLVGNKLVKERILTDQVKIKPTGGFQKATQRLTNNNLATLFISEARRIIG